MTRAEEAVRATTRAIASTVGDVPPLRLETAPDELGFSGLSPARPLWRGRLRTVIVPAAAAAAVAALAIALVLVRSIPNGGVASPSRTATSTAPANPAPAGRVPAYYVAWMQADRPYLLVENTLTGEELAQVPSPPGVHLDAVFGGSADGRTWLVQGTTVPGVHGVTTWYILTINPDPGAQNPLEMGSIGIPVYETPAGAVLSPDGKEAAVAVNGSTATLRVYSLTTGALLHSWSAPGTFAQYGLKPADQRTELALRWSPDGSRLGFTWNGTEIRAIPVTAPDGSLLARSTALLAIGPTYTGSGSAFICDAWQGWSLLNGGTGVLCAGSTDTSGVSRMMGQKPLPAAVGFVRETHLPGGGDETEIVAAAPLKTTKAGPDDGAYLGWANADGSVVLGSTIAQGKTRFGIFHDGRFSALPALPGAGAVVPAGVLYGADVW